MYKVIKIAGWLKGSNGTGNVYLLQGPNGEKVLAMIWLMPDGSEKFHTLFRDDFYRQVRANSAESYEAIEVSREFDGFIEVENAGNFQRIHKPGITPTPTTPTPEPTNPGPTRPTLPNPYPTDDVEIPFTISGTIRLGNLSGDLAAILNAFLQ